MINEVEVVLFKYVSENHTKQASGMLFCFPGSTALTIGEKLKDNFERMLLSDGMKSRVRFFAYDVANQRGNKFEEGKEFLRLNVDNIHGLLRNLCYHTTLVQLPGLKDMKIGEIKPYDGVGGNPLLGALYFIRNVPEIEKAISQAISSLLSHNEIRIYIIFSPLGGVASGSVVLFSYLIRDICEKSFSVEPRIIGVILKPVYTEQANISDSPKEVQRQIRNFYHTISVIDTLTLSKKPFVFDYGTRKVESYCSPFDYIFIAGI